MRRGLQALPAAVVTLATAMAATLVVERAGLIGPAQAQSEADKRKKEQEKHKTAPPRQHQPPPSVKPPAPTPKVTAPPPFQGTPHQKPLPPSERPVLKKQPPPPDKEYGKKPLPPSERPALKKPLPPPDKQYGKKPLPPSERPVLKKPLPPPDKQYGKPAPSFEKPKAVQPPPPVKPLAKPAPDLKPDLKKEGIKPPPPGTGQHGVVPPPKAPPELKKQPPSLVMPPPSGPKVPPVKVAPVPPPDGSPGSGAVLKRVDEVKKFRVERVEEGGKRKIIEEPGKRFIVKEHGRTIVRHDETERFLKRPGAKLDRRPDGSTETVYVRRDGVRIVTVVDGHGRLLRRYRIDRDGRERSFIDNRRFYRGLAVGVVGVGVLGIIALNLPPPRVTIPAEKYIVPYDDASDDDLYEALDAPPIEDLDRAYSLDEIRDNHELRARLRSIDIDTIRFESGAWEVSPDQHGKLARIARAMLRVLERNPEAMFLVAGYTDAVGSEEDNASLSDRRAVAVAEVLTEQFDVPAENLVTQGYGEQFLKIDIDGPEPRNRRVGILNITALMAER